MRRMQRKRVRLGDIFGIAMGCITAANSVFFVRNFKPTDEKGIVLVETLGDDKVKIEKEMLRPLLRGRNVDEWSYNVENYVIWTHDDDGEILEELPAHTADYLEKHKATLVTRKTWQVSGPMKAGAPFWIIGNADKAVAKGKVTWQEIAKKVEALYLPTTHHDQELGSRKLVVDHKTFFLESTSKKVGVALTGFLNSVLANAYVAAFVTRTGAEYGNFSSWVIGLLPIDQAFVGAECDKIIDLSRKLHKLKGHDQKLLGELDRAVAKIYGLSDVELREMHAFFEFFTN